MSVFLQHSSPYCLLLSPPFRIHTWKAIPSGFTNSRFYFAMLRFRKFQVTILCFQTAFANGLFGTWNKFFQQKQSLTGVYSSQFSLQQLTRHAAHLLSQAFAKCLLEVGNFLCSPGCPSGSCYLLSCSLPWPRSHMSSARFLLVLVNRSFFSTSFASCGPQYTGHLWDTIVTFRTLRRGNNNLYMLIRI